MRGGLIRFDKFELDVENFQLQRSGRPLRLERIPMELLLLLARQAGRLVTREEILAAIWGKGIVLDADNAINTAVRKIRRILHDDPDRPRYIETVIGKGYRFVAGVEEVGGEAATVRPNAAVPLLESDSAEPAPAPGSSSAPHSAPAGLGQSPAPVGGGFPSSKTGIPIAVPPVVARSRSRLSRIAFRLAGLIAVTSFAFLFRPTLPPPRITGSTQLTRDGRPKATMVNDGSRVYFSYSGYVNSLYQVSTAGGDTVPFPTAIPDPFVIGISPDRSELLVASCVGSVAACPLWLFPAVGGSPRSVGNIRASLLHDPDRRGASSDAAWSPDGNELAYVERNRLCRVRIDGTESRNIVTIVNGGTPFWPRWSPHGKRLRFSVETKSSGPSLWEVTADGKNLHQLLPGWNNPPSECCGSWTPDGKYFLFQARRGGTANIWAIREVGDLFWKTRHEPEQLTTGPTSTYAPLPSADGKRLFVVTARMHGELVRYDPDSRQVAPYLSGISAMGVNFSDDGKRVTYVAYPEGTLWRSNADGSERVQLTFPPLYVVQPRWSPDGTRIAFMGQEPRKPWSIYVIPADGGRPEQPVPGDHRGADPTWSPDGNALLYGRIPGDESPGTGALDLEIVDLRTHTISKVPGSEELWSPRWSRDGRHVLALPRGQNRLMLFDVKTRKWTELARTVTIVGYPEWSRDGDCIYFRGAQPLGPPSAVFRVRIKDGRLEQVVSLKEFHSAPGWGDWHGLAPDDSPLLVRDAGIQDIYALDWQAP